LFLFSFKFLNSLLYDMWYVIYDMWYVIIMKWSILLLSFQKKDFLSNNKKTFIIFISLSFWSFVQMMIAKRNIHSEVIRQRFIWSKIHFHDSKITDWQKLDHHSLVSTLIISRVKNILWSKSSTLMKMTFNIWAVTRKSKWNHIRKVLSLSWLHK
jgi:hypothetical protein